MSPRYCPDCGEQCKPEDNQCPECEFPLQLEVVSHGSYTAIEKNQLKKWKRISQILKRNGLAIKTKTASGWSTHQAWWALPAIGIIVFATCLLFGPSMIDTIWPPQVIAGPILDLNNPNQTNSTAQNTANSNNDGSGNADVSFLTDAFKVSKEQEELVNQNLNLDDYTDLPKVPIETIKTYMEDALLHVQVNQKVQRGALLNSQGMYLTDAAFLEDAFRRETRTVSENRTLKEKVTYVVPSAARPGDAWQTSSLVVSAENLGTSLLKAPLNYQTSYDIDFDAVISVGNRVWVCRTFDDEYYPELARVTDVMSFGIDGEGVEIKLWVLNTEYNGSNSGGPVFDVFGKLVGLLLINQGQNTVLPMLTIRERAPLIYKELN